MSGGLESRARALFDQSPFDFERWAVSMVNGQPNLKQVGDKGVDGVIRFPLDGTGNSIGRALGSVKGGKAPGPTAVRDLAGTVDAQRAQMGVLVTLAEPTRGMTDAAQHAGLYTWPWNKSTFPKVQIFTVAQLLNGEKLGNREYLDLRVGVNPRSRPLDSDLAWGSSSSSAEAYSRIFSRDTS